MLREFWMLRNEITWVVRPRTIDGETSTKAFTSKTGKKWDDNIKMNLYVHPTQYVFMAWCLVTHRDNFTLNLP
jgi:hypothetical protein